MELGIFSMLGLGVLGALVVWLCWEYGRIVEIFPAPRNVPGFEKLGLPRAPKKLSNLRCVHGMKGMDGKTVKAGELFRSARLNPLPTADGNLLNELGIRLIVDLRTPAEVEKYPNTLPPDYTKNGGVCKGYLVADSDLMENVLKLLRAEMEEGRKLVQMRGEVMKVVLGCANHHGEKFGDIVRRVAEGEGPTLIHCTAGKDRTGWAVAVILKLCGVSDEEVYADYMLSNKLWHKHARKYAILMRMFCIGTTSPAAFKPALLVDQAYLRAGFDAVRARWGTWEAYAVAKDGLALEQATVDKLRERLLV
eukprot:Hpha_TRINITY_DN3103_c0_g1::TRINITY_DN3103_c0_g1_i1::g.96679::m.96679/K01104/E3.1.3.48; protein-tyrosine phosphatase